MKKPVPALIALPDLPSIEPEFMGKLFAAIDGYDVGTAVLHLLACAGVVVEFAVRGPKPASELETALLATMFELATRRAVALVDAQREAPRPPETAA